MFLAFQENSEGGIVVPWGARGKMEKTAGARE